MISKLIRIGVVSVLLTATLYVWCYPVAVCLWVLAAYRVPFAVCIIDALLMQQ